MPRSARLNPNPEGAGRAGQNGLRADVRLHPPGLRRPRPPVRLRPGWGTCGTHGSGDVVRMARTIHHQHPQPDGRVRVRRTGRTAATNGTSARRGTWTRTRSRRTRSRDRASSRPPPPCSGRRRAGGTGAMTTAEPM